MSPEPADRGARIERVVASYDLLMRRVAAWHAPDLLEVAVTMSHVKAQTLLAVR